MKLSPRITVPVALALTLSVAVAGFLFWEIRSSIGIIETSFTGGSGGMAFLRGILKQSRNTGTIATIPSQSEALTALRDGEVFELKGEWKRAEEKFAASVAAGGGAPALRKLIAIELQRREEDAAEKSIGLLREERGNSPDVTFFEGMLALNRGDAAGAAVIFGKQPDDPKNQLGTALAAIARSDDTAAKNMLSVISQSSDPEVRSAASILLGAYGEFALFPSGQDVHLKTLLARALAEVHACEPALKLLQDVVDSTPRYRDPWIVKGYCEFVSERLKESLASLEQAYSIDPVKPEIQYFLARTYAGLGDPENAVTFLQYAITNGFTPVRDARELLAEYALELGNIDLALSQYGLLADGDDGDIPDTALYVNLAISTNAHAVDALEKAKSALKRWPDDPRLLVLAAKAANAAGLPEDASRYIQSALRIDPKNEEAMKVQEAMKKGTGKPGR